jgi:ribosome-binding protein aMBF1 (putative translation factor)
MGILPGEAFDDIFGDLETNEEFSKEDQKLKPYYDLVVEIIRRRKVLGLTQKELAERIGTHQSRISKIEAAEHDVRLSTLIQIAEALEAEISIQLIPAEKSLQTENAAFPGLLTK